MAEKRDDEVDPNEQEAVPLESLVVPEDEAPAESVASTTDDAPKPAKPTALKPLDTSSRSTTAARRLGAGGPSSIAKPKPAIGATTTSPPTTPSVPSSTKTSTSGSTGAVPRGATGRRPLVSKEAKDARAAEVKSRRPFYARIPLKAVVAVAAVGLAIALGYVAIQSLSRAKNPEERLVREQLYEFRFDLKDDHLVAIDKMGPQGVTLAIKLLTDKTPAETANGHSSTSTQDLANQYLLHYAARLKIDPPAKALEVQKFGAVRQPDATWPELQKLWTTWFSDVQSKGQALAPGA